jgi:phosphosulfolactate synthase (CoM biosynthesis protein A)
MRPRSPASINRADANRPSPKAASERAFSFLEINARDEKPRRVGLTEIRGPYYTPVGNTYLEELLEVSGDYVDSFKFAGGSFCLFPRNILRQLIETAHRHSVQVSTGGFIERVLARDARLVDRYIDECADLGFDIIEISSGFITLPTDDWIRLIQRVQNAGLKAKPEVGIQFGAGAASQASTLVQQGIHSVEAAISNARRFLDLGVPIIMIESEGITESVTEWRSDIPEQFANALGLEKIMFEAADPEVFAWYIKHFGADVNLFVDHSQIIQLETLRRGIWGPADLWGKVVTFKNGRTDSR